MELPQLINNIFVKDKAEKEKREFYNRIFMVSMDGGLTYFAWCCGEGVSYKLLPLWPKQER